MVKVSGITSHVNTDLEQGDRPFQNRDMIIKIHIQSLRTAYRSLITVNLQQERIDRYLSIIHGQVH